MSRPIEDVLALKSARVAETGSAAPAPLSLATRMFLRGFLAFLALSALVGIVSILGGQFGDFELKVLGSTVTISLGSLCAMCCVKCGNQRDLKLWSVLGVALTLLAALLLIGNLWVESHGDGDWKLSIILAIAAVANAHVCALFFARLSPEHQWVQGLAAVVIGSLALLLIVSVADASGSGVPYRMIAVLAVLDLGLTIGIPILHRLDQTEPDGEVPLPSLTPAQLVVTANGDGSYSLADGRRLILDDTAPAGPASDSGLQN